MLDVITIGTATRDIFLKSAHFKVLKDPKHLKKLGFKTGEAECFALGSKLDIGESAFTVGGGAANAAVTFARQRMSTGAIMRVGDEFGDSITKKLETEKIKLFVVKDKKVGTAHSTILLTPGGERTILVYRGASSNFQKRDIPTKAFRASWAYITPGKTPLSVMQWVISNLKRQGAMIAMNPSKQYLEMGPTKMKPIFKSLNVVIVNREEASYLTGVDYGKVNRIFKKFDDIVQGIAVMTDGPKGSFVSDGRYLYKAGVFKEKQLIDRSVAGDAFGSGFVAGFMKEQDICLAMRLASANATSVVEHMGTQKGILSDRDFSGKRWHYLDLDIEPL